MSKFVLVALAMPLSGFFPLLFGTDRGAGVGTHSLLIEWLTDRTAEMGGEA